MANKKEEVKTIDYTSSLNKIFICLVMLIIIMVINTTLLLISVGEVNTKSTSDSETEVTEYDVSMFTEIDANAYADLFKKDELAITYFGRSDCGYCIQFLPTLQKVQKEYNLKIYYVDINKIDQEKANIIFGLNEGFNDTLGRTPMITVTKNNELKDTQMGAVSYDNFVKFLQENEVIKK